MHTKICNRDIYKCKNYKLYDQKPGNIILICYQYKNQMIYLTILNSFIYFDKITIQTLGVKEDVRAKCDIHMPISQLCL